MSPRRLLLLAMLRWKRFHVAAYFLGFRVFREVQRDAKGHVVAIKKDLGVTWRRKFFWSTKSMECACQNTRQT